MARIILLLVGLVVLALGVLGCICWWDSIRQFIMAFVAIALVLLGLLTVVLAISEFAGPRNGRAPATSEPVTTEEHE